MGPFVSVADFWLFLPQKPSQKDRLCHEDVSDMQARYHHLEEIFLLVQVSHSGDACSPNGCVSSAPNTTTTTPFNNNQCKSKMLQADSRLVRNIDRTALERPFQSIKARFKPIDIGGVIMFLCHPTTTTEVRSRLLLVNVLPNNNSN